MTIREKVSAEICRACGGKHTFDPCPHCGQRKWSLHVPIQKIVELVLAPGKRTKEVEKKVWQVIEKEMFGAMLYGRSLHNVCACTIEDLMRARDDTVTRLAKLAEQK